MELYYSFLLLKKWVCIKAYQNCNNAKAYFLQDLSFINETSAFNVSCTAALVTA